jgi:hypothetical protein
MVSLGGSIMDGMHVSAAQPSLMHHWAATLMCSADIECCSPPRPPWQVVPTVAPEGSGNMYDASYEWPEDSIPMNSKPVQIVYNVHALATKDTKHKIASAAVSLTTILLLWLVLRDAPAAATPAAKPAQHSAITPEPAPEPAPEPSVPMPEPFPQCLDSGEHPTCGDHGGCGQALGGLWECRCDVSIVWPTRAGLCLCSS